MKKVGYENIGEIVPIWVSLLVLSGCAGLMGNFKYGDKEITVQSSSEKELAECKENLKVCQVDLKEMTKQEIECIKHESMYHGGHPKDMKELQEKEGILDGFGF